MALLLQADMDELHKLADALAVAAQNITKINATTAAEVIAQALPGSGLDGVCTQAGQDIDGAYQRVAGKLTRVSGAINAAAQSYLEQDTDFAAAMRKFDIEATGSK